jgi:tetratricopeptide (TPR) repeat protein
MKLSKRAAELKPTDYSLAQDYAVNFFVADQFSAQPDWDSAAAAWQKARGQARRIDEVFYTWMNEARAWMRKPDPARAETCLQEALKIYPDNDVAKSLLRRVQNQPVK